MSKIDDIKKLIADLDEQGLAQLMEQIGGMENVEEFIPADKLTALIEGINNNPQFKGLAKQKNLNELVRSGLGAVGDLMSRKISKDQIKLSDSQLKKIKRPTAPNTIQPNKLIDKVTNRAEQDRLSASAMLAPAQNQIVDQYFQDLNAAKTASTGQASQFGTLANVAAQRRNRSAERLVPAAIQARQAADDRLASMVPYSLYDDLNQFNSQMGVYEQELGQYNQDMEAAGLLGATGRSNLLNSNRSLLSSIADLGEGIAKYSNTLGFGPEIDDFASTVDQSLVDYMSGRKAAVLGGVPTMGATQVTAPPYGQDWRTVNTGQQVGQSVDPRIAAGRQGMAEHNAMLSAQGRPVGSPPPPPQQPGYQAQWPQDNGGWMMPNPYIQGGGATVVSPPTQFIGPSNSGYSIWDRLGTSWDNMANRVKNRVKGKY